MYAMYRVAPVELKVFMCCECDAPGELLLCLGAMSALYEVCQGGIRCVCVVYAGLPKLI